MTTGAVVVIEEMTDAVAVVEIEEVVVVTAAAKVLEIVVVDSREEEDNKLANVKIA